GDHPYTRNGARRQDTFETKPFYHTLAPLHKGLLSLFFPNQRIPQVCSSLLQPWGIVVMYLY
ncbi:MAG: hypothetical protein ACI30I_02860, partial [Parabacteroides sp.]